MKKILAITLFGLAVAGCATEPMTPEEATRRQRVAKALIIFSAGMNGYANGIKQYQPQYQPPRTMNCTVYNGPGSRFMGSQVTCW